MLRLAELTQYRKVEKQARRTHHQRGEHQRQRNSHNRTNGAITMHAPGSFDS